LSSPKKLIAITQAHLGLPPEPAPGAQAARYVPGAAPTEANLCDWIASALVGHCMQYHEGLLLRDISDSREYTLRAQRKLGFPQPITSRHTAMRDRPCELWLTLPGAKKAKVLGKFDNETDAYMEMFKQTVLKRQNPGFYQVHSTA